MAGQGGKQTPAGWFPDPQNPANHRYWDGVQWTEHVRAAQTTAQPGPPTNEPSAFGQWWREHWSGPVIGAVAFLIGIGIGAAGGNTSTTTVQHTATETTTAAGAVKTQVQTQTQTVKAPAPAPTPSSSGSSGSSGGGGVQHFSGNGGESLGTITVPATSTLRWTNTGGLFAILDDENAVEVNSQAHSGQTILDAGSYHHFETNAIGDWTIRITPGG